MGSRVITPKLSSTSSGLIGKRDSRAESVDWRSFLHKNLIMPDLLEISEYGM
jgi:hypothetical protein